MNIYVYSDESGVFDHIHNKYFVYGGIVVIGDDSLNDYRRKYAKVEKDIREATHIEGELKAVALDNKYKNKIFRSLNGYYKFAGIIEQWRVNNNIWNSKKDKQRYLDFAYKIAIKRAFEELTNKGVIIPNDIEKISFFVDEHTTATNGRYELREGLEQELKNGTYNYNYSLYFPPIFPGLSEVTLDYCNSALSKNRLIRAADIVANTVYYHTVNGNREKLNQIPSLNCTYLP